MTRPAPSLGSPTLVLVPTPLERRGLERAGGLPPGSGLVELCGFGPILSAARSAALIARLAPRRVLLLGIAGAHDPERDPVGAARVFDAVACDGVGAGEGPTRLGPRAMRLPQWPGDELPAAGGGPADAPRIEERLALAVPSELDGALRRAELLTVCAASADRAMADERRRRFPAAAAEDMEGFAVAAACALAGVPCAVVRGISNRVGDRDLGAWRIDEALAAARALALELLGLEAWNPAAPGR